MPGVADRAEGKPRAAKTMRQSQPEIGDSMGSAQHDALETRWGQSKNISVTHLLEQLQQRSDAMHKLEEKLKKA